MKALFLLLSSTILILAGAMPIDGQTSLGDDLSTAQLNEPKPSDPSLADAEQNDDLTSIQTPDYVGYGEITLVEVRPPPRSLFSFSSEPRDYSIDKKFSGFLETLQGLVDTTGFNDTKFSEISNELKYQHILLRGMLNDNEKLEDAKEGVVEMFNTTNYFYSLMRYYKSVLRKVEHNEFDEYDAKSVQLYLKQLKFEISLISFLGFNNTFVPNPQVDDIQEKYKVAKQKARSLELELGSLIFEKSRVKFFTFSAFDRITKLMNNLEKFIGATPQQVDENVTDSSGDTTEKVARSLSADTENYLSPKAVFSRRHPTASQNIEQCKQISARLDELLRSAPTMNLNDLRTGIDNVIMDFEKMELQTIRWRESTPTVSYEDLEKVLTKLDELEGLYKIMNSEYGSF